MKLIDWMRREEINDAKMASLVGGYSIFAVRKWKYGVRVPPVETIIKIRNVTQKKVDLEDWLK